MTREEIFKACKTNYALRIRHINSKTAEFYVTGYEESVFHKCFGWWISDQTQDLIGRDTIKIKKEDLKNWFIVKDEDC